MGEDAFLEMQYEDQNGAEYEPDDEDNDNDPFVQMHIDDRRLGL